MEAILHSVLLRQEQMVMQWDAEFEQQKQLFHMNTSALIDMLPVRPRKKRLKVEQVPSQYKENLVAFQGFVVTGACVKSPKTKAPPSRGLAKRDLNTRFCDSNGAKDAGRKAAEAELPRQQSALPDAENAEPTGRAARAVRRCNQVSLGVVVKVEVDEDEMPSSLGENKKRIRGELHEENVALRSCIQESKELSSHPEEGRTEPDQMAAEDAAEKKSKPKRARVIGKAKKDAVEVENLVQSCEDTHAARPCEPEIAVKVEVELEGQPCRDSQAVETAEPEIPKKQPARRGRAKGAVAKADAPEDVVKEPVRRGRTKKAPAAAVPEIAQRVTRSRARKVESVVEAETGPCEPMAAGVVASRESIQIKEEVVADAPPKVEECFSRGGDLDPKDGDIAAGRDAEGEGRSANPMVEGTEALCEPQVCAPSQEAVIRDEPSIKVAGQPKVQNPATRSRKKNPKSSSVAFDIEEPGSLPDPRLERIEEAVGQPDADSAARSRKKNPKSSSVTFDIQEPGSLPDPRLERIEEAVGQPDADSASAEHQLGSLCKGPKVEDRSAPLAGCEAPPAKEDPSRSAAPERDALVEVSEGRTKENSRNQVAKTADGRRASNRRGLRPSRAQPVSHSEATLLPLAKLAPPKSDASNSGEVSEAAPTNTQESYTTLLSEMIQGSIPPPETVGALAPCSEAVAVARPSKSSFRSGESASAATAFELTAANRDCSPSQSEFPPNAATLNRKSTIEDGNVDGRDGSGEEVVEGSTALASEGQGAECEDVLEECSIEANIQFAERSWHEKGDNVQDAVVNAASEVSRVKEAENAMQSRDGASGMNGGTREQVKSDAISPVRYSEARAIEEAMRCSLEQEFHPDVTLTLNRWQFRRRLSPRSKARARRWRSDVATNGVEYGRGQPSEAPAASPSRAVSSRDRSMEGAVYETFLEAQSPIPDAVLGLSLGTEKAVDEADTTSWQKHAPEPEKMTRRSIASLCNEVRSQAVHDGETGDNSVEYEVMGAADEAGNLSPLLRSIYKLSKACEKDMVGVDGILEEDEQQQVHSLIESAKKIVEQVSSKRAQASGAQPGTPGCDHPDLNSSRFYDHTSLYPDRFRLFISPRASGAAPAMPPAAASIFPVSRTPVVAFLLAGDMESTSPRTKRLRQETMVKAASRSADRDSTLSESIGGGDDVVSRELGEGESVRDCYDAVVSGCDGLTLIDGIRFNMGSDVHQGAIVGGKSAVASVRSPRGSHDDCALQSCEGSVPWIEKQIRAADIAELVMHESEVALSSGTVTETEKLSQLKSRFHALSKDCMVGTSSVAKDAANLVDAELKSSIKHSSSRPSVIPSLRFSPGYASEKRNHVRESPESSERVDVDAVEDEEPGVYVEGKTGIPCSPISIGNQRGPDKAHQAIMAEESSLSPHGVEATGAMEEEVVVLEGISEPSEEAASRSQSMASVSAASMLRVEPQHPSNLVGAAFGPVSSSSNLARSNIVANIRSFVPLVQQHQPAAPYPNGKRDVKVKALEAAEAAKRLAELKELEKQERKKAVEIAKREKQERVAQEKLAKREKAAQDKLMKQQEARAEKENGEANKRKAAGGGATKSVMADSTNSQGTSSQNVLLKVKKTYELKQKMDQEKQERLLEEQRRKEEEWKKKEAENAARKRKHEAAEKKEREDKRRRQEDAVKAQREMEERQRLELEKKAQKQKLMEEMERERKAIEEELKRTKRLDKEREVEQRRKKEQEKEVAWLDQKEVTRKQREEAVKLIKLLETEGRQQAGKMRRPSEDPAVASTGAYHTLMATYHAVGIAEGVGGGGLSGVINLVDPQRVSSQSLVGHSLRVPQQSGEGVGAACRNSQAALRVPRTTPESGRGVSSLVGGAGKPLVWITPEALGTSAVACGAGASGGPRVMMEAANVPQVQSGTKAGAPAMAGGSKPCQPRQAGFAGPPGGVIGHVDKGVQTYEISPYRDSEDEDSDEEEKRSLKPIPQWARKENMWPQLVRQLQQDPDDIFIGANSCSLDEVFEVKGSKKRPCFKRRGSSGDWVKDCLTWQEQMQYKVAMGYLR